MALTTDAESRDAGLIWSDRDAASGPCTHVLIAGVGRFDGKADVSSLSSPPVSARYVADWFIDGASGGVSGFINPARPLGTLTMLLSENEDGSRSRVAEGTVPRASFSKLKKAVRDWIDRSKTNPDNMMILFIASHGISAGRRTALLCEDYGSDELDALAGLTEVDQFVSALRQIDVASKLLIFDCCRNEDDRLNPTETLGNRLIGQISGAGLHQEPTVLCSAVLGTKAFGRSNGPTLFTEAMLEALNGLAANPAADWRIEASTLSTVTGKLMALNERHGKRIQIPQAQLSLDFPVAVAPPTERVSLFVSVEPPFSEDPWMIVTDTEDAKATQWGPASTGARFARIDLPAGVAHKICLCDAAGNVKAEKTTTLPAPVAFQEIPDPYAVNLLVQRKKNVRKGEDAEASGQITIQGGNGIARIDATVTQRSENPSDSANTIKIHGDKNSVGSFASTSNQGIPSLRKEISLSSNYQTRIEGLDPGSRIVSILRADGKRLETNVEIGVGDEIEITVPSILSPHEWLKEATYAGAIDPSAETLIPRQNHQKPEVHLNSGSNLTKIGENAELSEGENDGRFFSYAINDFADRRISTVLDDEPVWASASMNNWYETAFIPTQGMEARWQQDWKAGLVIDTADRGTTHMRGFVFSPLWNPLLTFLGARDFASSAIALHTLGSDVRKAVRGKRANPLAACAGALTAVACGTPENFDLPEQWLVNLAEWFPTLPDGAVALGRHMHRQGDLDGALDAYQTAFTRGTPVFSLSVDWLGEGLSMLAPDNAATALRWAQESDPTCTFTVLKRGEI